jgi:transposase
MEISRKDIRKLVHHEFCQGHKAPEAVQRICATHGEGAVSYSTAKRWFQKFKKGNFDVSDKPHARRPPALESGELLRLVEEDSRLSLRYLAKHLQCSKTTVDTWLHELGRSWK